ncbi:membrane bound O-acyl transferase family-domain-containing protein [Gymnopilus junonius]|uniref:Membrane bound O-acyl transferase family-domain-containing protein n=1 Tax=Gymnopilus junonius TaxID=109634 RepID=A0A9P5NMM6_GYMJU|nr:membrane bound O-acyl transferase family-domain-containing protein [Gymnopilus junonius]
MRGKKDLPSGLVQVALSCLLCTGLVGGSVQIRRLCFLSILLLYTYVLLFTASDNPGNDFISKLNFTALLFNASDYLLLCDPQHDLRLIGQTKLISHETLIQRLWWALRLLASPRGVGWNFESTSHLPLRPPSSAREPKWKYVMKQVFWIVVYYPIWHMASYWNRSNPRYGRDIVASNIDRTAFPWWWRVTVWATIVDYYALMTIMQCAASSITVAFCISDAQEWPPLFASPLEAYTVRRYWGRMWHQLYRKIFASHSKYIADCLHLPPKSKITTYFKLYLSFFISGVIHCAGDYGYLQEYSGGALRYFLLHACAITFEDGIIGLAKRAGFRTNLGWRIIGYFWVIIWFSVVLPEWIDSRLFWGLPFP